MNKDISKYATYLIYILILILTAIIIYILISFFTFNLTIVPNNSIRI